MGAAGSDCFLPGLFGTGKTHPEDLGVGEQDGDEGNQDSQGSGDDNHRRLVYVPVLGILSCCLLEECPDINYFKLKIRLISDDVSHLGHLKTLSIRSFSVIPTPDCHTLTTPSLSREHDLTSLKQFQMKEGRCSRHCGLWFNQDLQSVRLS